MLSPISVSPEQYNTPLPAPAAPAPAAPTGPYSFGWNTTPLPTDPSGRPMTPKFNTIGDDTTGLLKSPYNITNNLDTRALEAGRAEALRDPSQMSRWGQMALAQGQNQNAAMAASQLSQGTSNLAMQGGLRSGARERLQAMGNQNRLLSNQNVLQNVNMQDEQNRMKWLQMQPGAELMSAQYGSNIQDKNISRAIGEIGQGRELQQRQYDEMMRGWAAAQTANAAANANPGSSGLINDDVPIFGGL
jgi:hypothetical protein